MRAGQDTCPSANRAVDYSGSPVGVALSFTPWGVASNHGKAVWRRALEIRESAAAMVINRKAASIFCPYYRSNARSVGVLSVGRAPARPREETQIMHLTIILVLPAGIDLGTSLASVRGPAVETKKSTPSLDEMLDSGGDH